MSTRRQSCATIRTADSAAARALILGELLLLIGP